MLAATHRSAASLSSPDNISGLNPKQQRRRTAPANPLNLPEPIDATRARQGRRSPSPLRNGHTLDEDSDDGSDVEEDDRNVPWGDRRPTSPASSVTKFATNIAQRVGSFMSPGRSPQTLPTDAELEAEGERERERSMKEAERIIAMERLKAENRMTVEERVMAMLQSEGKQSTPMLIPQRSQNDTPHTPSPTASQTEKNGWWTSTMSKLTPTKEPLTAAQQVILETKIRDKEKQKEKVPKGKDKEKTKEWPSSPEHKYSDPSYANLGIPQKSSAPRAISSSPSSSTPAQYSIPPSLNPSPLRGADSPSKSNLPLYAQFNSDGVLDVHGTLLTIAKRFEKLEKWTVSHVRALEDRMDDVERWLVEKEKEKEKEKETNSTMENGTRDSATDFNDMSYMREELAELQGRVGEIGREMAKMATSPGNLSSGPSKSSSSGRAPSTMSSVAVRSMTVSPPRRYSTTSLHSSKDQTSPPITPLVPVLTGSRTRLPYPTGDYATPPDSVVVSQGHFSPTGSPTDSLPRRMSYPGLPTELDVQPSPISGLPRSASPVNSMSTSSGRSPSASLPPPKFNDPRPSSVSPTPRKRYTVALGGPIMSAKRRSSSPPPQVESSQLGNAYFSSAGDEESDDETVGKSAGKKVEYSAFDRDSWKPRPQSTSTYGASLSTAPLQPRLRSRSIVGLGISDGNGNTLAGGKFVDPLIVRKQEKVASSGQKSVDNKKKKAVGDLVAFFDGGEK